MRPAARRTFGLCSGCQATEQAVLNVLVANEEIVGFRGHRTPALPRDQVTAILQARGLIAQGAAVCRRLSQLAAVAGGRARVERKHSSPDKGRSAHCAAAFRLT